VSLAISIGNAIDFSLLFLSHFWQQSAVRREVLIKVLLISFAVTAKHRRRHHHHHHVFSFAFMHVEMSATRAEEAKIVIAFFIHGQIFSLARSFYVRL
jgi:hypothetical protein